jgi:hypothetical protein
MERSRVGDFPDLSVPHVDAASRVKRATVVRCSISLKSGTGGLDPPSENQFRSSTRYSPQGAAGRLWVSRRLTARRWTCRIFVAGHEGTGSGRGGLR